MDQILILASMLWYLGLYAIGSVAVVVIALYLGDIFGTAPR